ncbi:MAG TPA: OmpA family protein [Haliangiales bacterium]|nr:OmpA family protein [Haliangiales bacterium]
MKHTAGTIAVGLVAGILAWGGNARGQSPLDSIVDKGKKEAGNVAVKKGKEAANKAVVDKVNAKLLAEGRKNQCSFKVDSDELAPGCDAKAKKLANALIDAKKTLSTSGMTGWKFVVYGHTDSTGKPDHNKELSQKRAAAIARELVARGVPKDDIESVGMGAEQPLVKPDDTEAKRAKNRRYEIQVKI